MYNIGEKAIHALQRDQSSVWGQRGVPHMASRWVCVCAVSWRSCICVLQATGWPALCVRVVFVGTHALPLLLAWICFAIGHRVYASGTPMDVACCQAASCSTIGPFVVAGR